jgi:hypothetical protein
LPELHNDRAGGCSQGRPTPDFHLGEGIASERIEADAVFLGLDLLAEPQFELLELVFVEDALKHAVLHALAVAF